MKKVIAACAAVCAIGTSANASIVSALGPNSSAGTAAAVIGAPSQVLDSSVFNTGQQGFDERQNVLLGAALSVDGGTIAANTRVSSHMIFLNQKDGTAGNTSHFNVNWLFDGIILGVMSDSLGALEVASTPVLGAIGTTYPGAPFTARGLEGGGDGYSGVGTNTLTLSMNVTQPGDWVRVVTAAVPVPAALPLLAGALGGLGALTRRKRKKAA